MAFASSRHLHHRAGQLLMALLLCLPVFSAAQSRQDNAGYDAMLSYLSANSRIDGKALSGSQGLISINQAAGDLNLQANLHGLAAGRGARVDIAAQQSQHNDYTNAPMLAQASIGGNALAGASGIASINQASGGGNMELNSMTATLAEQGIRESSNEAMSSASAFASAGEQYVNKDPQATRKVAVEATALRGFNGVLQLNQVAGSGNATGNSTSISVQPPP